MTALALLLAVERALAGGHALVGGGRPAGGGAWLQLSGLSPEVRLGATVGTLVVLAVAWLAVEAGSERLRPVVGDRTVETIEVVAFTTLVGGATAVLLLVWDAVEPLRTQLGTVLDQQQVGVRIVTSVLLLSTAYGLTRVLHRVINRSRVATVSTDHRREVAYNVVQVTVYVVGLLVVLAVWQVDVGNLLLGAGVLGVVVGLAARETLGAVIAGFVLLFSKPFAVGDWVAIADREGIVSDITIVNTRLRTFDGEQVMIPNDRVTGEEILNRSREGQLRGTVDVGVDYDASIEEAIDAAETAIEGAEMVLEEPTPRAVGKEFGGSAVVLELQFWIDEPTADRMWAAKTEVLGAVREAYAEAGITIPYPQRTIGSRDDVALADGTQAARAATDGSGETPDGPTGDAAAEDADETEPD